MALYEVTRNDEVQPGEFVSAFVIAGGTAQARGAVAHMTGVTKSNVSAERVELTGGVRLINAYWDERDEEPTPLFTTYDSYGTAPLFGPEAA